MTPFDFLFLRSPLQSLNKALTVDEDFDPLFDEGLYLASSQLWKQLERYNDLPEKEREKLKLTIKKYWLRSCSRCTPYGTFAGGGLVKIGKDQTSLILNDTSRYHRSLKLDMNCLSNIIKVIEKSVSLREQIKLFANNSLYELPYSYRYAELYVLASGPTYQLTSVEKSSYISELLAMSTKGATINELSSKLSELADVNIDEALQFVNEMWNSQLLISELEPCLTGDDPLHQLITILESYKDIDGYTEVLKQVISAMSIPDVGVTTYFKVENLLEKNFGQVVPKDIIQTDLYLSFETGLINENLINTLLEQVKQLMSFSTVYKVKDLEDFRTRFYEKFEDQEVPLEIAIDSELGAGYADLIEGTMGGSSWIDDLPFAANSATNNISFDFIKQFSLNKYEDYLKTAKTCIEIEEKDLLPYKSIVLEFPSSMYLTGSLLKKNGLLDEQNFTFDLNAIGGPSGANLLGRFAYGDESLADFVKKILALEATDNPDAIYAEIVHLPQARIGNVLSRPTLREYEIPYIGKSGLKIENQIFVSDLMVSVVNNQIVLRSKKFNKRVIPRLTTAHNFHHKSLPIYKFLCDLQRQNIVTPIIWDWGVLASQNFLPRVTYKNVIVKKATWKISENEIKQLKLDNEPGNDGGYSIMKAFNLPQNVVVKEGDNKLLIDLESDTALALLMSLLKKNKRLELEEYLFDKENCVVTNKLEQPFTNELILPFRTPVKTYKSVPFKNIESLPNHKRKFSINSEWLYFKIYCGPKIADKLLSESITDFIENGLKEGLFQYFFFIRYRDTLSHIRIRFFNADCKKQAVLQELFMKHLNSFIENGMIYKVVLDTYTREDERYGQKLIEDTEKLFFNDSLAVLRFIGLLDSEENEKYRILFAIRGVDYLLNDFGLTLKSKLTLFKNMVAMSNQNVNKSNFQKVVNAKYKQFQKLIFSHMDSTLDIRNEFTEVVDILDTRSKMNFEVTKSIMSILEDDEREEKLFELFPSYIHMFFNRLFFSQQNKYELLIYNFIERYYSSKVAVSNKSSILIEDNYQKATSI